MDYIIQNWSDLNLVDRAWFLVGIWLLLLFGAMVIHKTYRRLKKKNRKTPNRSEP